MFGLVQFNWFELWNSALGDTILECIYCDRTGGSVTSDHMWFWFVLFAVDHHHLLLTMTMVMFLQAA